MERKPATYADLVALPDNVIGELIGGVLHASPWPAGAEIIAGINLGAALGMPIVTGRGGTGGWVMLRKPELRLGEDVLVPDLVGWHHERIPNPREVEAFTMVPDWVCEVIAPSTQTLDLEVKLPVYAREGVRHVWLVDPRAKVLEVLRLEGSGYSLVVTHSGPAVVRAEPFDAVELKLSFIWGK
ncbi:Uma2 family endonuclease [Pyxidicoccus parkwayensis]|uniref:Uma2 family endonuclease n=1 Tax=Pyxidicoccus parkwayensis TaxID=2813578 RepID=A0ABX7NMK6_9BACT|nr:Uma2 family endonuclease [Pyxidicoccus parkwaysis]QSQ18820.1 Uma2 family endonuclease [Pyxidicoccus parkwaysis]